MKKIFKQKIKSVILAIALLVANNIAFAQAPGNALNFNGVNNYVQINHNSLLNSSSYTLECWVNINSFTALGGFISKYNIGGSLGYRFSLNSTAPYSGINFDGLETVNGILETGKWYHVVAVNNNNARTVYVNGVEVALFGSSYNVNTSNNSFLTLGVDFLNVSPRWLNGKMDEVRLYNVALSQSQVQADMFSATSILPASLMASYNFNQGVASGNNPTVNYLADQSSNALDGLPVNFALTGSTSNWVESYAMVVPTAIAATSITNTGFTANWTAPAIGTVDNYLLDVSTNSSFTSFVSGYNGLNVSGTSEAVTGLSSGVTYYYRVRANKASVAEQGGYSNVIVSYIPPGNALNFGGNDRVLTSSNTIGNFGTSAFTVETWIKTTQSTDYPAIVNKWNLCNAVSYWNCRMFSGKLQFEVGEAAGAVNYTQLTGNTTISDGKWHHIAYTRSATGVLSLYVDGVLDATTTAAIANISNTDPIRIGYSICISAGGNALFQGSLDEMRIWNVEKTQAQLQASMYNVINASSSNLIAYYNFDNGVAGANNAGINTLTDLTPNANNSTIYTFALNGNTSNWVESYAMVVPTAIAATSVTTTGFIANWTAPAVGTIDNYLLDVSTNSSFSSFVSGYNGLSVAGTSQTISGLSQSSTYYYRIRANKASVTGQGGYSSVISIATCVNTTSTTNLSICSTALPYSWNGLTFNAAGSQTYHTTNATGCDSAATLNLTVKATTTSTTNLSICPSALPYSWNSLTFNAAGSQTAHLTNTVGCDSAATLNLIIKAISSSTTNTTICSGALPYNWNGLTFNVAGSQTAHLTNAVGCDSAATLNLSVTSTTSSSINVMSCGSYTWNGTTYTTNGSYNKLFTGAGGCDSIATLNLTVVSTLPSINGASAACAGSTTTLTNAVAGGVWFTQATSQATINPTTGFVIAKNAGTITIQYSKSGCGSVTKTFTIHPIPAVPTIAYAPGTNGNLFISYGQYCVGKTFSVVGTPAGGVWSYSNPLVGIISSNGLVTITGVGSGSIKYVYTSAAGCSNSRTMYGTSTNCAFRGVATNDKLETTNEFSIYPNPARSFISLNVETLIGVGNIVVTDLYGKIVKTQPLSMGSNTVNIANLSKGFYLVSVITSEGKTTKKLVVE